MRIIRSRRNVLWLLLAVVMTAAPRSFAQEPNATGQQQPATAAPQPAPNQDPIEDLKLTPEQREQIRKIRESNRDERFAANQRSQKAQRALDDALDSDNPNEEIVEQRARDFADARAAEIRMRYVQEVRIRRVLTPEQQAAVRQLRLARRAEDQKRQQQQRLQNQIKQRRLNNAPNQGNGLGPGGRRNNLQRRPPLSQ
jgi:Spy/CpxP family protein refolding chaperone